eukprot:gb/GECH01004024.1/.p1 GENE.gb/GECH01004024.1/~~gb/GECH01004024.1/.p1  ORF type:complete len:309 (+),score=80.25 gb/GECH01004024.1/:1-927(+)
MKKTKFCIVDDVKREIDTCEYDVNYTKPSDSEANISRQVEGCDIIVLFIWKPLHGNHVLSGCDGEYTTFLHSLWNCEKYNNLYLYAPHCNVVKRDFIELFHRKKRLFEGEELNLDQLAERTQNSDIINSEEMKRYAKVKKRSMHSTTQQNNYQLQRNQDQQQSNIAPSFSSFSIIRILLILILILIIVFLGAQIKIKKDRTLNESPQVPRTSSHRMLEATDQFYVLTSKNDTCFRELENLEQEFSEKMRKEKMAQENGFISPMALKIFEFQEKKKLEQKLNQCNQFHDEKQQIENEIDIFDNNNWKKR